MSKEVKIYCKNIDEYINVTGGDTLLDVARSLGSRLNQEPLCAIVNNKSKELTFPVFAPKHVEFLDYSHHTGHRTYVHSLCMVMYKAINDLYPDHRLRIEHSFMGGYYCRFKHDDRPIGADMVSSIKARMNEIVAQDIEFVRHEQLTQEVIVLFKQQGLDDKARLLETLGNLYTTYYSLDNIIDSYYSPLVPSTGYLKVFDLQPYEQGMILLPPTAQGTPVEPIKQPKMFKAFTRYVAFNDVIKIDDVGTLNKTIKEKGASLLIAVSEAMHNKMFAAIADDITRRYHEVGTRMVLIAGPSSSGKTTSSKRLAVNLMTNCILPKVIEMDNYFVDRTRTPRDEDGEYDFESLYAVDLELFNRDLTDLLAGKEVALPTYNFEKGCREYRGNTLKLEENNILLIEGIHGLNPELTKEIPEHLKYRIYVSALTTLSIDDHNWIPSSDNRLIRRIVRDNKYRGCDALTTISRWDSVRRGEEKWIYPYQENADAIFNSSLLYELAVMRQHAEPVLRMVPSSAPEYAEAHRLLHFLEYFEPLDDKGLPSTSLLREFLGGSTFAE